MVGRDPLDTVSGNLAPRTMLPPPTIITNLDSFLFSGLISSGKPAAKSVKAAHISGKLLA